MQAKLKHIESRLQAVIEKNTARLFTSLDVESKLAQRLVAAMQARIQTLPDGSLRAPHIFSLSVHPRFVSDIRSNQNLLETLADTLYQSALEQHLTFDAHPTISVFPNEQIIEGDFEVQAIRSESPTQTRDMVLGQTTPPPELIEDEIENIPPKAFLIVAGSKIFALEHAVVNIGRKLDNHLVLDDPRISRKHSQLRAIKGRFVLFDVGSSGGTFVNGERVTRAILHPGDVISLAGVPMVYGQDAVRAANETQEYRRPSSTFDDTTASLDISDLDLDDYAKP